MNQNYYVLNKLTVKNNNRMHDLFLYIFVTQSPTSLI
nr:MAG TPA: hypothetical protein [Caudoviricetes sp.]